MTKPIEIYVYEEPAPQGSKRHVGHGVMIENNKEKVGTWRQAVIAAARETCRRIEGPVRVDVYFTVRKPKSAPKRRQTFPARKPDGDKLLRATHDALVIAGVIQDDAAIVDWGGGKRYPNERSHALNSPGAYIRISEVCE